MVFCMAFWFRDAGRRLLAKFGGKFFGCVCTFWGTFGFFLGG